MDTKLKLLFDTPTIQERIHSLGTAIARDYTHKPLTVISVMNGALFFTADLLRHLPSKVQLESVRASSYRNKTTSNGNPTLTLSDFNITNRHVLILDEILDTGHTLWALTQALAAHKPLSIETCVLLNKQIRRQAPIKATYTGFEIDDHFVVGYGMDFAEEYRTLPAIYTFTP